MLIAAIPQSLQYAISGGIGLFITYIGIKQAHLLDFTVSSGTYTTLPNGNVVSGDIVPALADFTDPVTQWH